ncbi:MAG TPA: shikimate kinase [Flavobacterium lutivivi]|nr:shikimate kinase [Flavobacterium lutivivi]
MENKIILTGYMGSGKTTVGKLLSNKLGFNYIDLDDFIESKEKKSIKDIFSTKGEIYFRKLENNYLIQILDSTESLVLSLGGGTPCYSNNHELLKRKDLKSIYLKANIDTIFARIKNEKFKRPILSDIAEDELKDFIAQHLFERSYFYLFSKFIVEVDNKSVEEIVEEILQLN